MWGALPKNFEILGFPSESFEPKDLAELLIWIDILLIHKQFMETIPRKARASNMTIDCEL